MKRFLLLLLTLAVLLPVAYAQQRTDARAYLDPETGLALSDEDQARLDAFLAKRPRTVVAARPADSPRRTPQPPTYDRGAIVFTVDSAFDDDPDTNGDGVCAGPVYGECQLRSAIEEANAQPDNQPVRIEFDITTGPPGSEVEPGMWRITLLYDNDGFSGADPLPSLFQPNLTVDGLTQPGASCGTLVGGVKHDLRVILDGSNYDSQTITQGIFIRAPSVTVRGLVIQHFWGDGILSAPNPDSLAECNYVGTDHTGQLAAGNFSGINIDGTVQNNLVSGNTDHGIEVLIVEDVGDTPFIENNLVGTDVDGDQPLGNGRAGVLLSHISSVSHDDVTVRGNVISANENGIKVLDSGSNAKLIYGNLIGLSRTGQSLGLGNEAHGIYVTVGGFSRIDIGVSDEAPNYLADNGGNGIRLEDSRGLHIRNNVVGLDAAGNPAPNSLDGISLHQITNTTGLTNTTVSGNTVSANGGSGIRLEGASGSALFGNTIGLSPSGQSLGLGNAEHGILLEGIHPANAASDNDIGLPGEAPNRIADNADNGIGFEGPTVSDGNRVRNNVVGLDAAGNPAPNGLDGISLRQTDGTIISGNTVSANAAGGILLFSSAANTLIEDNLVGLGPDGSSPRGNGVNGIAVLGATGVTLHGNTVSDNGAPGILLSSSASELTLTGNKIGTTADGTGNRGNAADGLVCQSASDVLIGGTGPGDGNTIAFNGSGSSDGLFLREGCQRAAVLRNSIHNNAGLGIDHCPSFPACDDVTPNDSPDADGITNYPVITSVTNDGTDAVVTVSLDAQPNQPYRIELFRTGAADPSGFGEGRTFIANRGPTTNASGAATTTFTRPASDIPLGQWVSATATPIDGATFTGFTSTSEFSEAVEVEAPSDPLTVTITPTSSVVLERGDRAYFDITFEVGATGPSSFEFWTEAVLPNGSVRSPLIGPNTVNVSPPATVTLSFSQRVPSVAPFGSYTYRVEAGTFPGTVLDSDSFAADVVPGRSSDDASDDAPEDWEAFDAAGALLSGSQVYDFRSGETETTEAAASEALPAEASLTGAYPNPFSRSATVGFAVPSSQRVRLAVYDVLGREVAVLADGEVEAGRHTVVLDGAGLPSGVYLVRLVTDAGAQTQRLTLVR